MQMALQQRDRQRLRFADYALRTVRQNANAGRQQSAGGRMVGTIPFELPQLMNASTMKDNVEAPDMPDCDPSGGVHEHCMKRSTRTRAKAPRAGIR